jgi:hypothetical protein
MAGMIGAQRQDCVTPGAIRDHDSQDDLTFALIKTSATAGLHYGSWAVSCRPAVAVPTSLRHCHIQRSGLRRDQAGDSANPRIPDWRKSCCRPFAGCRFTQAVAQQAAWGA